MSVIPQEENLVMSFSEATRVFNTDQSNIGTNVPGTGDATTQLPRGLQGNPSDQGSDDATVYNSTYHTGKPYLAGEQSTQGTAGVIPPVLPTQEEVRQNPDTMVEIRNPRTLDASDVEEPYYNPWFSVRSLLKVYFAEFLGTAVLVIWGEGTQAQVVASRKVPDDYISIAWGWGVGFMLAIYISSGISGGHVNPAVTISLAIFRKFSWKKVPGYCAAQLLGGFTGGAVIYGVYYGSLHSLQGGFASVLTTGPIALLPSTAATVFSVFTPAALLMGAISAFTDTGNNPATPGLTPLLLGLIMVGIASGFGYQTGFVLNPARDLGPRLLIWATGDSGKNTHQLWLNDTAYGIWIPTVGTIAGAIFGNFMYDVLIYNGRDSPLNMNWSRKGRHMKSQRARNSRMSMDEKPMNALHEV